MFLFGTRSIQAYLFYPACCPRTGPAKTTFKKVILKIEHYFCTSFLPPRLFSL